MNRESVLTLSISAISKVVVTSDEHLGYANSEAEIFLGFLRSLSDRSDIGGVIILGDFVDMWRRDVSGLFLEFGGAMKILEAMSSRIPVKIVVGNHDYHLLKLLDHDYPFEFLENYSIPSGGANYKFMHGWEFDYAQHPVMMELLCHNLSDTEGGARSAIYNDLMAFKTELQDLFVFHRGVDGYLNHLLQPPEVRLQPYLGDVEKQAFASVAAGEKLIFGHTHRPFVSTDGRVANSGSWVTDAALHNTYVELDGQTIRLFAIDENQNVTEILQRVDPPV